MGLAHACKSKGLVQGELHMETQWEKVIKKVIQVRVRVWDWIRR